MGGRAEVVDLGHRPHIPRANDGPHRLDLSLTDPIIAVEVPADWTGLQQNDLPAALAWRAATDTVLSHYTGAQEGKYAVTGVGTDGERRFLLAEQVTAGLWERLGRRA